ncbi:flavin reductase domain protein FMN-binding protein [Xylanimonas cellulosilytica DSM 15894]|uniref:Flavin reductase domain protein FMN-binding protein n=1 Tax=Xylanimonas cellulosilytica (strain DSM 15894 / JCM 12276 / CECT 5975 / KCTC 9989 / LMG 20990 / NBRC 107835 / XIL07) TaxID=446471 RepID=D1BTL9_XYLCX|nr:flavin reductase family protein [Xylanimonas cellulosilytica]ACZ30998.1 flavin reductase domain protein FMN-binding protein [Xylanimonas cellulosilytica DSM 15894]
MTTTHPDVVSADAFRSVFRSHPAGVAVITTTHAGRPVGFTATSVISVSADPPVLAFSLASTSSSWPAVEAAATVAVSFLAAGQAEVSTRFATSGIDRFAAGGWHPLDTGEPVIDGAVAWLRARVIGRIEAGSSHLVTVEALWHRKFAGTAPLVFHDRGYHHIAPAR